MNEQRFVVSDSLWQRLEPHFPGKASDAGGTAKDNRLFLEAVFWRVRTGSPRRDLPLAFGNWSSQFRRFRRWAKAGVFERLFKAMSDDPDLEYALIDGTIGPVPLSFRPRCSFMRPELRKPRGFSSQVPSAFGAGCRSR